MSSMSPTIIMDKNQKVAGIIGASGGTRIITGTLEVSANDGGGGGSLRVPLVSPKDGRGGGWEWSMVPYNQYY